ncbi:chitin binding peritrophin-A domain-containing protein [Streptomyces sp. NPDC051684]|uniref:chitin binding peritrophin-A domain-containing protein n=1 Tax=Streptomyces sp. NPDC051684 TaxID=3365670 RepID=UPI0037977B21
MPKSLTLALAAVALAGTAPLAAASAVTRAPAAADPFVCPVPDGMFANPADPATFYHCSDATPYLQHCPANLYWSQALQRCEWPAIAGENFA